MCPEMHLNRITVNSSKKKEKHIRDLAEVVD